MLPLDDLTVPQAGERTARLLFGEYLRHVTRRFLALPAERVGAPELALVRDLAKRLLAAGRPGAVYAALRRPTVSLLVRVVDDSSNPPPSWLGELAALAALELGCAGARPDTPLELPCPPLLCAFGLGRALRVPPGSLLELGPTGSSIRGPGFRVALDAGEASAPLIELDAYHPIQDGLVLATEDVNPLASLEAHPEKSGSRVDLGGREIGEWQRALRSALALIEEHLPELAAEMKLGLCQVIPVGYSAERHESASYAEAIGSVYSSLHPDPLTMAEALIHEFSHNKLNALAALEPVLEPSAERFTSPVRPDPRPLFGVLLAVHAFVPVALLYQRMRAAGDRRALEPGAERRFRQILRNNRDGTRILLEHAHPAPAGARLLDELRRWDDESASW